MLFSIIFDDFRTSWEIWKKVQFFKTRSRIILLALNWRDEIEIFILLFSCFETRSRLHIVILMFREENEKHRLNLSRSSEKNLTQFSRDLARTRILSDLWLTCTLFWMWFFYEYLPPNCLQNPVFVRIDENSPLWEVSPKDLLTETFEIVLTMEGTTPETGNNIQVPTITWTDWNLIFYYRCGHPMFRARYCGVSNLSTPVSIMIPKLANMKSPLIPWTL